MRDGRPRNRIAGRPEAGICEGVRPENGRRPGFDGAYKNSIRGGWLLWRAELRPFGAKKQGRNCVTELQHGQNTHTGALNE